MDFISSGKYYADKGFSFFPAGKDKKPLLESWTGLEKRTPTPKELQEWGQSYPEANIALICGQLSDLTTVECDSRDAIRTVEELIPDALDVPTATRQRKCKHYYFRYTPGLYSHNGTSPGIHVYGAGGYILVPPSRTDEGEYFPGPIGIEDRPAMPRPLFEFLKKRQVASAGITLCERDPRSVTVRPIPYLWRDVLPTHMATSITGDMGVGKSLVAIDCAARISSGTPFPVYSDPGPAVRGHVFYLTSEGIPEMILVPRLMAANADLSKVTIIEGVLLKDGEFSMFDVTKHLPMIASRAKDFPDLKMIVIDPVASFIPERINTGQQNQVRQMMDRISDLAYKLGVACVPVMHFNKALGLKAGHRTSGSVQFSAAVKMSWSVVHREGGPRELRLLVPQKSNITGGHKSLSFTIQDVRFPVPSDSKEIISTARIKYGELVDEDPEKLISPPIENDSHVADAKRFLQRKLAEGTTLYAVELITEAETQGIPKWALYKAKDRLGVQHDKEGSYQGRTFWFMPKGN